MLDSTSAVTTRTPARPPRSCSATRRSARCSRRATPGSPAGRAPIDARRSSRSSTAPRFDAQLEAEIRQLVIARNYRRTRAGKSALDVRCRGRAGDPAARRALASRPFRAAGSGTLRAMADPRRFETGRARQPSRDLFQPPDGGRRCRRRLAGHGLRDLQHGGVRGGRLGPDLRRVPIDEPRRDELLETFQVRYHPVGGGEDDTDEEFEDGRRTSGGSRRPRAASGQRALLRGLVTASGSRRHTSPALCYVPRSAAARTAASCRRRRGRLDALAVGLVLGGGPRRPVVPAAPVVPAGPVARTGRWSPTPTEWSSCRSPGRSACSGSLLERAQLGLELAGRAGPRSGR